MMKMLMVLFVIAVGSCQGGRVKREDGTSTSTSTLGAGGECVTVSGPAARSPCVFPFTFKGKTYHACTLDDTANHDKKPWCSTKVDSQGNHVQDFWGRCTVQCGQSEEDQVVFVVGGLGPGFQAMRSTEVLDVTSSTCSRATTDIPVERYTHTVNYIDGEVIVCGDYDSSTRTLDSTTFKSCISSRSPSGPWLPHSTTNKGRSGHSSVFAGGRLHLVGGDVSDSEATMETLEGNTWTLHDLPYRVSQDSCSVQTGTNEFVVTGGLASPSKMYKWGEGNEWTRLDDLIGGRYGHGCTSVTIKGVVHVVVAGGRDSSYNRVSSSAMYNMDTGVWTNIGQLGEARYKGMMVNVRAGEVNRVLIMGGRDDDNDVLSSVEELLIEEANVAESTWQLLRSQLTNLKKARFYFGAIAVPKSTFC